MLRPHRCPGYWSEWCSGLPGYDSFFYRLFGSFKKIHGKLFLTISLTCIDLCFNTHYCRHLKNTGSVEIIMVTDNRSWGLHLLMLPPLLLGYPPVAIPDKVKRYPKKKKSGRYSPWTASPSKRERRSFPKLPLRINEEREKRISTEPKKKKNFLLLLKEKNSFWRENFLRDYLIHQTTNGFFDYQYQNLHRLILSVAGDRQWALFAFSFLMH